MPSVVRTFFGVKGTRGDANGVKAAVWRWVCAAHPDLEWRRTRTGTLHKSVFDEADAVLVASYHVAAACLYDVLRRLTPLQAANGTQEAVAVPKLGHFCPDKLVASYIDAYSETKRVRKGVDKTHLHELVRHCVLDHAEAARPVVPGTSSLAGAGNVPTRAGDRDADGHIEPPLAEDRDWVIGKRIAKQLRNDVAACVAALFANPHHVHEAERSELAPKLRT